MARFYLDKTEVSVTHYKYWDGEEFFVITVVLEDITNSFNEFEFYVDSLPYHGFAGDRIWIHAELTVDKDGNFQLVIYGGEQECRIKGRIQKPIITFEK